MITDECNYLKGRQNCSRSTPRRTKTSTARRYIIKGGNATLVYHHAIACIFLRLDDIQCFALMICNSYGIDDIHAFGVIGMRECEDFRAFRVCRQIRTATRFPKPFKKTSHSKFIYKSIDATAFWTDLNCCTTPPAESKDNTKKMLSPFGYSYFKNELNQRFKNY